MAGRFLWDFWLTAWHWDTFFLEYFGFHLSVSLHQCSVLFCIFKLLLPAGQMDEAWLLLKQCSVGYRRNFTRKSAMKLLWQRKPEVLRLNPVTLVQVFSEHIGFSLSVSLTSAPYIHMLLFTRRVKGRSLGTVKK